MTFIFIIFSSVLFVFTQSTIKEQTEKTTNSELLSFAKSGDNNFNTITRCADYLMQYLKWYKSKDLFNHNVDQNVKTQISRFISSQTNTIDYITEVLVYSENRIYTSTGQYDIDTIYSTFYGFDQKSKSQWFNLLQDTKSNTLFRFSTALNFNRIKYESIEYWQTYTINNKPVKIIYLINLNKFFAFDLLNNNLVVATTDNNIYLGTKQTQEIAQQALQNGNTNIAYVSYNSLNYVVSIYPSNTTLFSYIHVQSHFIYWKYFRKNFIRFSVFFILSTMFFIGFSIFITKQNCKPLNNIINIIPSNCKNNQNEFSNIISYIKETNATKQKNNKMLEDYKELLNSIGVDHILHNCISPSENLDILPQQYKIKFIYPYFYVIIFNFEEESSTTKDIKYMIKNILRDYYNNGFKYYCVDTNNTVNCIINSEVICTAIVKEKATEIKRFFRDEMNINIQYSIGGVCTSISQLPVSYNECLSIFNTNKKKYSIINKFVELRSKNIYKYINKDIELIEKYIKSGNPNFCVSTLNVLFNHNLCYSMPAINAKCFLYNILTIALNYYTMPVANIISSFMQNDTVTDAKLYVDTVLKKITEQFSKKNMSSQITLSFKILNFIEENAFNDNLSVAFISDEFNKSASYISKIFKESFSVSPLEYIQLYRINESMKLLNNTNLKIKDIAQNTGFTNCNTYIRTFKKLINQSPNEFRKKSK